MQRRRKNSMRIVFMGTPAFAASILEELAGHFDIVGVYTREDAVRGRGKKLMASPVKEMGQELGLKVFTPQSLRDAAVQQQIASLRPDCICVAAYGAILPPAILDIPPLGCLNVHASLLPRWRGAAPIERAILAGDEEVGVCIMRMEEGLDTGDYCVVRSIPIQGRNAVDLTDELANLGARALITALAHIEEGNVRWVEQDEDGATYAEMIAKGELNLDPGATALENARRVQASSEAHPARCVIAGRGASVLSVRIANGERPSVFLDGANRGSEALPNLVGGEAAYASKRLLLGCSEGTLEVLTLKPDGKREMDAASFAAGMPALRAGGAPWS